MPKVYRFPEVKVNQIRDANMRPCFHVLCREYGNSKLLYSQEEVDKWIAAHTKEYVLLEDHEAALSELTAKV